MHSISVIHTTTLNVTEVSQILRNKSSTSKKIDVSYETYWFHNAGRIVQVSRFDNLTTAQMFLGSFGLLYYTFMSGLVYTSVQQLHDWWITGACSWDHGPFSVNYASPTSGEAYRDRRLTTNFELWVEIFCVSTCFHVRIPKPCPSVCVSAPREKISS